MEYSWWDWGRFVVGEMKRALLDIYDVLGMGWLTLSV